MPVIRTLTQYRALTPLERQAVRTAFHALELMREAGLSLAAAAPKAGTSPAIVRSYIQPALERRGGRWVALPNDRLLRVMQVLSEGGVEHEVAVRSSRTASLVGAHWSAIGHYLVTGDAARLEAFQGKRVAGHVLETDPDAIDAWERRGELQVDDIYSLTS